MDCIEEQSIDGQTLHALFRTGGGCGGDSLHALIRDEFGSARLNHRLRLLEGLCTLFKNS